MSKAGRGRSRGTSWNNTPFVSILGELRGRERSEGGREGVEERQDPTWVLRGCLWMVD